MWTSHLSCWVKTRPQTHLKWLCCLWVHVLSVGVQANATARGISLTKLEIELEGDINITAVWGTGDVDPNKKLGVTEVRAMFTIESPGTPKEDLEALVAHAIKWSPVANTYMNAVDLSGKLVG